MEIAQDVINNIINNVIKENNKQQQVKVCLICHDPLDGEIYSFCCNKQYHEECLVSYVGINMYPKCPICRKWIKKDIKDACDIIYKEYQLKNARKRLKLATEYTEDVSFYSQTNREHPNTETQTPDVNNPFESPSTMDYEIMHDLEGIGHYEQLIPRAPIFNMPVTGNLFDIINEQEPRMQRRRRIDRTSVRNQVSMMQRMFEESWRNFFNDS